MTIASTTSRKSYAGNGVTTSFATSPVVFFDTSDLEVYVVVTATGVAVLLTENTNYTATGGAGSTGTVDLTGGSSPFGAPSAAQSLVIVRTLPLVQGTDFVNNDPSDAEVVEDNFDKAVMIDQQLQAQIDLSFRLASSDVSGASTELPTPQADRLIGWDGTGTALVNYAAGDIAPSIVVSAYMLTVLDDANAAAAQTTLDVYSKAAGDARYINNTLVAAKGDIIGASGNDVPAIVTVGSNGLALTADSTQAAGVAYAVRNLERSQCPIVGPVDTVGSAAFLTTGSGLRPGLDASPTNLLLGFAAGFDNGGNVDTTALLTADAADPLAADLPASSTSFIHATRTSDSAVTWASTLFPQQMSRVYDKTAQELLRFAGTDASTSILSDYGNTWAVAGNAQIDTAVQINGLNTLLLDGTGDYVESTNFTSLGGGSWTMECKVRWNTLPTSPNRQTVFSATNASFNCMILDLFNNVGTTKLELFVSSNGTSADVVNGTVGTKTAWATATTYHIALTFDALAGKYIVYVDGVLDQTTSSTARVAGVTRMDIGSDRINAGRDLNAAVAGFRFSPCCRYPNGTTFTAPDVSTFAVEGHWYSIVERKMYEVTSASGSAGTNPGMTARNRLLVGEADTSGAAVTAVRSYAYKGRYQSADTTVPAVGTRTAFSGNLGLVPVLEPMVFIRNLTADAGYTPGMVLRPEVQANAAYAMLAAVAIEDRNTLSFVTGSSNALQLRNRTTGVEALVVTASWKMFVTADRGW